MTAFLEAPTAPSTLLVLSLLSTGGQHHENELKDYARINRPSDCISKLKKAGWEIQTIAGGKGEGSSYMMTNPDQLDRAQTFDITSALVTMENPPIEAASFENFNLTSTHIASQLSLFTASNLQRDSRYDIAELIAGSVDVLRKAQIEILSGKPSIKDMKAQGKLAKALVEVLGAIDILNGKEKPE